MIGTQVWTDISKQRNDENWNILQQKAYNTKNKLLFKKINLLVSTENC